MDYVYPRNDLVKITNESEKKKLFQGPHSFIGLPFVIKFLKVRKKVGKKLLSSIEYFKINIKILEFQNVILAEICEQ